jgi:hypothetical protein
MTSTECVQNRGVRFSGPSLGGARDTGRQDGSACSPSCLGDSRWARAALRIARRSAPEVNLCTYAFGSVARLAPVVPARSCSMTDRLDEAGLWGRGSVVRTRSRRPNGPNRNPRAAPALLAPRRSPRSAPMVPRAAALASAITHMAFILSRGPSDLWVFGNRIARCRKCKAHRKSGPMRTRDRPVPLTTSPHLVSGRWVKVRACSIAERRVCDLDAPGDDRTVRGQGDGFPALT